MQYILLILLGAGLWLRVYSGPCEISLPGLEAPMFLMLINLMPDSYVLLSLIGFSLLILQAFLINIMAIKHELLPKNSLVVAMVFILLMSQPSAAIGLTPLHFAGIFVILAYNRILSSYGTADPTKDIFSAAFLIALASLFHFAAIFLLIILILSLIIFGTFSPRIFLVAIAGVVAVYLYLLVYYYLTDNLQGQYCMYVNWFSHLPAVRLNYSVTQMISWSMQVLVFIAAVYYSLTHMNEWNISGRKMQLLNIWFAILAIATLIYAGEYSPVAVTLTAVPLALIIGGYFLNRKRIPMLMEIFFLLWFLISCFNNLFSPIC